MTFESDFCSGCACHCCGLHAKASPDTSLPCLQLAIMETVDKHPRMRFLADKEVDDLVAEIEAEKGALEASRRNRQTAGQPAPEPT